MGIFVGKNGKTAALFVLLALGLYLTLRFLLPLAGPFILAFFVVYLTAPLLGRLQKKLHIRREILLAVFLLLLAVLAGIGLWALVKKSADRVPQIYRNLAVIEKQLILWLHGGCDFLEKTFGIDAQAARQVIIERLEIFAEELQVIVWPTAARQSFSYLKKLGAAAAFGGITLIAAILLCREYEGLAVKMRSHPILLAVWQFAEKTVSMVGGYVKAQLCIIGAISAVAVGGLWIGRVDGALVWGLLAGLLDALPFIGTSIVLWPLAFWQLLNGKLWSVAAVVICYFLCILVREFLEPRLLGKQLGISPVVMLFSVYAGMKVFGIAGLFLGPLYVMLLREGCRMYREREEMDTFEEE